MRASVRLGCIAYAIGVAGMGVQNFVHSDVVSGLEPVPLWVPGRSLLAYLTGVILIATGVLMVAGKRPRLVAISVAGLLFLWVVILHLPKLLSDLSRGNEWTTSFETLELAAAAWILAGILESEIALDNRLHFSGRTIQAAQICFAVSFLVFGVLHFIYHDYTASVIPSWIPAHMFWAYFTGIAHIAAGAGILFKVKARLAAMLLGLMVGSWALILHVPRVVATPGKSEWTSLFIAIATSGSAWIVAGSLGEPSLEAANRDGRPITEGTLEGLWARPQELGAYGAPGGSGGKSRSRERSH